MKQFTKITVCSWSNNELGEPVRVEYLASEIAFIQFFPVLFDDEETEQMAIVIEFYEQETATFKAADWNIELT